VHRYLVALLGLAVTLDSVGHDDVDLVLGQDGAGDGGQDGSGDSEETHVDWSIGWRGGRATDCREDKELRRDSWIILLYRKGSDAGVFVLATLVKVDCA
jgi:hypothetical protein